MQTKLKKLASECQLQNDKLKVIYELKNQYFVRILLKRTAADCREKFGFCRNQMHILSFSERRQTNAT